MNLWAALSIAIVAAGIAAFVLMIGLVAVTYGVFWIFVFGDNPWPSWVDPAIGLIVPLAGLMAWGLLAWVIWRSLTAPPRAG